MYANKWSAVFSILAVLLSLQLMAATGSVKLEKLNRFRRRCYTSLPMCIMQSNNASSRGCGQCDADIREAPVRELRSLEELTQVALGQDDRAIALVPERVFFSLKVRSSITFWKNIDAIIVYEGPPRRQDEFADESVDNETTPDLLFNYSLEETEPNRRYNFYGDEGSGEQCALGRPRRNLGDCTFQQFIPFNIFYINASLADDILSRASRFRDPTIIPNGNDRGSFSPQYNLQSIGRMWACATNKIPPSNIITNESNVDEDNVGTTVTAEQCLRDRTCLPIGGHSVWSALGRVNSTAVDNPQSYLFITAPMDSYAFFPEFGLGTGAEISSLAVLMAVAEAVATYWRQAKSEGQFERQPVYFAFNAETWGYAGSGRFLRDMLEFECAEEEDISEGRKGCKKPFINNLKFKEFNGADIKVLNLGQLITPSTSNSTSNRTSSSQFFTHHDDGLGAALADVLNNTFRSQRLTLDRGGRDFDSDTPLTPIDASQSFNFFFNESRIDVVSITNYPLNFSSEVYHSMLDTELRISQPVLREPMYKAAHAIASAIVNIAFGDPIEISVDTDTIDNVITCMTGDWTNCPMVREYLGEEYENTTVTPGNYAGVFFPSDVLPFSNPSAAAKLAFIQAFFAHHNRFNESAVTCNSEKECTDYDRDINEKSSPQRQSDLLDTQCTRGRCVTSDTYTHRAFGGGINMVDSIGGFELERKYKREEFDGNLPHQGDWTESFWDPEIGFCGQVQDSDIYEAVIFGVGLCVLVLSFIFGIWLDRALFDDKRASTSEQSSMSSTGESLVPPV